MYPTFAKLEWWDAQLEAGDCFFLPSSWYHHVYTKDGLRSISVNLWWWRNEAQAQRDEDSSCPSVGEANNLTASECKFGYENKELEGYDGLPWGINKEYEERSSCTRGVPSGAPLRPSATISSFKKEGRVRPRGATGDDFVQLEDWLASAELRNEVERSHNRTERRAALKAQLHAHEEGDEVSSPVLKKLIRQWEEFWLEQEEEGDWAGEGEASEDGFTDDTERDDDDDDDDGDDDGGDDDNYGDDNYGDDNYEDVVDKENNKDNDENHGEEEVVAEVSDSGSVDMFA